MRKASRSHLVPFSSERARTVEAGLVVRSTQDRRLATAGLLTALALVSSLAAVPVGWAAGGETLTEASGTVCQVGDFGFAIVPDHDRGTRFGPDELPAPYQKHGLRVVFSGKVLDLPAGARTWATPFDLTEIRKSDSEPATCP